MKKDNNQRREELGIQLAVNMKNMLSRFTGYVLSGTRKNLHITILGICIFL